MAASNRPSDVAIALNRFGLGARGNAPPGDPRAWLLEQIPSFEARPAAFASARTTPEIAREHAEDRADLTDLDPEARMEKRKVLRQRARALYRDEVGMRVTAALTTPAPFVERLVHFWSNHFAISADKPQVTALAGAFEREAIRPHVLGRFEDMLLAVERHPAMLLFLDQVRSVGPNSRRARRAAERGRRLGINENLAREILELHTLGARGGYTQHDVGAFALALSGWTVDGMGGDADETGAFRFRPQMHEPGPRTLLGRTYAEDGADQARAVLRDVAASEATARHVATKLARHFIADDPPPGAVDRLTAAFVSSGGDLPEVYRALIGLPDAWDARSRKFKTPWEWTISALRGLGRSEPGSAQVVALLNQLGQPTWQPRSPAGYDDVAGSWAAPEALVRRIEIALRLARPAGDRIDARERAPALLPGVLTERTQTQIARAESPATALALMLASPEFQRR
ncbi:DUF1800 domain-containing protein [Marinivivus vitaminiproducens]|uniref:DUF1800 domain-containing protein n=1 Tax=Marinivivus vitaminiproducens TaxID=3035935 RepID=UPI00279B562C|nr:DUF1800 domain-containing protein [Geminicoccaceae bacterium SCSIO 64248]